MSNTPAKHPAYAELCRLHRDVETLGSISSLLNWDQETYMPHAAGPCRADQQAAMSAITHERSIHPRIGELIAECERDRSLTADAASVEARNIREMRRDFDLRTKIPTDLVAELTKVCSQSQEVWKEARQKSDFATFLPWLEKVVALTRRKAECLGFARGGELYDALIDEYEPGATAKEIESVFNPLGERLSALIKSLLKSGRTPSDAVLKVRIDPARQHELGQFVLKAMGFDFEAGRLDTTTHPFCQGVAPGDTRLTTRYRGEGFADALYSTMHEGGHGLYEQGLPKAARFGEPAGQAASLGIHESQSRMWENFVGRSPEFWRWLMPHAKKLAGGELDAFSDRDAYGAVNVSRPSLIRVEADESTYNLHVMIRFTLERALISGSLKARDLPGEWNGLYKKRLGVDVPDDRRGCLQDVHWSGGMIGYFPTYTLGNLYAAQLWETINREQPGLKDQMARGEFGTLKDWLNTKIHAHGRRYRAGELCEMLTGKPLGADPLLRHLEGRLAPLHA